MPTLQIKLCPRLAVITLLALALAQLAAPANAGVQVEVRGVGEDIRANVLAYLSFERYKNSDDLSPEFVERLQERSEREVRGALRPFGFYEPVVTSEVKREGSGSEQNYRVIINIMPGKPVVVDKVDVKVTGPGRHATRCSPTSPATCPSRPATASTTLTTRRSRAGCCAPRRPTATSMRACCATRCAWIRRPTLAQIAIEFETGERYRFGATTIKQDSIDDALMRRFLRYKRERLLRRDRAAAHAVRARRQPVLLHRRSAARRSRSRKAHRAHQHRRRAESPPSLPVRRRLRHRHRRCAARSRGKTGA